MIFLKIFFLFLAVAWTGRFIIRLAPIMSRRSDVTGKSITTGDISMWAAGIVGFITCQWLL